MIKPETFSQIDNLYSKGGTIQGISRELKLNIKTVRKYVRKGLWSPYKKNSKIRNSISDPSHSHTNLQSL